MFGDRDSWAINTGATFFLHHVTTGETGIDWGVCDWAVFFEISKWQQIVSKTLKLRYDRWASTTIPPLFHIDSHSLETKGLGLDYTAPEDDDFFSLLKFMKSETAHQIAPWFKKKKEKKISTIFHVFVKVFFVAPSWRQAGLRQHLEIRKMRRKRNNIN